MLFRAVVAARERQDQRVPALELAERADRAGLVGQRVIGEGPTGDDVGTHEMTASPLMPRVRRRPCTCLFAVRTWLYLEAHACLPVGVPVGASTHTSASPASLKRRAILGQLAARSPRHHEASDGNGAFARTVSAIPGPSTRMAAATSATSRVSRNATLSSPACPPQVGGSRWWESVRTMSASTWRPGVRRARRQPSRAGRAAVLAAGR